MRIGIAGAGLIGRLLAWQLARRGHAVVLFEQDADGAHSSAAWVAASMLAPWSEAVAAEPDVLVPGIRALSQWPQLLEDLRSDGGTALALHSGGTLVLAHRGDSALLGEFESRLQRLSTPGNATVLDSEGIAALEPELGGRFTRGLHLPEESALDYRALLDALASVLDARVCWRRGITVTGVAPHSISSAGGDEVFDLVVDCRGFGARHQLPALRGVRGEVLWIRAPEVGLTRALRLMHPRYQLYISPRADHHYVVGATQIESESEAPLTVRSGLELLSALYTVHRGFAEAHIVESHARCRPAFPDNLPRVDTCEGMVSVNGLYRHGFLLAPVVLEQALAAIAGAEQVQVAVGS